MNNQIWACVAGLMIGIGIMMFVFMACVVTKDMFHNNVNPEVTNKHMQELSKSCIETHNGTFTIKVSVGNKNNMEYECVIGGR